MKLRAQPDHLGEPVELGELRSLIMFDDFDNPVIVVQKLADGVISVSKATEPEFEKVVKGLGIGLHATYTRRGVGSHV